MKTISPALQDFLLSNTVFGRADLIVITLRNGGVLNVVSGSNQDIVYSGTRYYASKFGVWQRGAVTGKATFKPSSESMELAALIPESVVYPGTTTSLMQVVNLGMLAGGTVTIQTLFWPQGSPYTAGISMGTMQLTSGQIGNVRQAGRTKIVCEVFDQLYRLNRPVPPFAIQSSCRHTLFDASCTLSLSNFITNSIPLDATSTSLYLDLDVPARANSHAYVLGDVIDVSDTIYRCVTAGTSAGSAPTFNPVRSAITIDGGVHWSSQSFAYPLGYVLFITGQNAGLKWSIKVQTLSTGGKIEMQLIKPLPFAIAPGDLVQLVPGCDKTVDTCLNAFNNLIHIGSMPFVPNPEVAQ